MRALPFLLLASLLAAPLSVDADPPAAMSATDSAARTYPGIAVDAHGPQSAAAAGGSESDAAGRILAPLGDDLASIEATLALPAATWYNDKDGDKLFDSLERRFQEIGGLQEVIVTFAQGTDVETALQTAQSAAGGFTPHFVYHHYGGFAAHLDARQAQAIAGMGDVRQVEWAQPGTPELETATAAMGARAVQQELALTGDLDGLPEEITGEDVTVAIMDTGFDGKHVDLEGKFLEFIDWEDGKEKEPYDSGSHGTHVASIVGGLGVADANMTGVAPGAAFIGFKISGARDHGGATGSKAGAMASIDWMLGHHHDYNIRVSTISFGFGTTVDGTDALEIGMDHLFLVGVLPFKSTGNSGPEVGTVTVPGGARGIVGTANMGDPGAGGMHLRTSSSRGPTEDGRIKPDLAAPGTAIMAAKAHDPEADDPKYDEYTEKTGTSMASPFAAGTAALVFAADPSLGPAEVRDILFSTAHDWGLLGKDIDFGHGRIDTLGAVQKALVQKALREGRPYDDVAALNVTPPRVPAYLFGVVEGNEATDGVAEATFDVTDTSLPLAVAFIVNGTDVRPDEVQQAAALVGSPADRDPPRRAFAARLVGPDGAELPLIPVVDGSSERQSTFTGIAAQEGTYTLEFMNILPGGEVYYMVSGGLPADTLALPWKLPAASEYEATLLDAHGRLPADDAEASGLGLLPAASGLALAGLAWSRRHRR